MSIRQKILMAMVVAIVLTLGGVTAMVSYELNSTLIKGFNISSRSQLERLNAYVDLFFSNAQVSAKLLANSTHTIEALDSLPSYKDSTKETMTVGADLSPAGQELFQEMVKMQKEVAAFSFIYVGTEQGGYTQSPDDSLPAGYNPPARPWYSDTVAAGKPLITEAYLSIDGAVVCTIAAPVMVSGKVKGVAGIDVSLDTLTTELSKASIGKTGYVVLLDHTGQVICDPKNSTSATPERDRWLGKNISDLPSESASALRSLRDKREGILEVPLNGKTMLAGVITSANNWTMILFQEKDEIFSDAMGITLSIAQVGLLIMVGVLIFAFFIASTIAKPVVMLANAAEQVAKGDLNAIPEAASSSRTGELHLLHSSLLRMVATLKELIGTAQSKMKEAEEALALSAQSLQQAEEAKLMAEKARQEGVLQTAEQLSTVVGKLSAVSTKLASEINGTEKSVTEQQLRVTDTAAAMTQMNVVVGEVAGSIARTSSLADTAKEESRAGKKLVDEVVTSIASISTHSKTMHTSLVSLGGQVADINKIMLMINDIADQTNLLALNAAIEAARAGDAGRGFAVVADEVRKLAENTMQATKQVGDAIHSIQAGTEGSLKAMEEADGFVTQSSAIVQKAGDALNRIEDMVVQTADEIRAIATASEEQSATADEISRSTATVSRIAEDVADGSKRSSQAVHELMELTRHIEEIMASLRKG